MILLQPHAFDLNRSSRSYLFISDHKIREGGLGGRNPGGVREGGGKRRCGKWDFRGGGKQEK